MIKAFSLIVRCNEGEWVAKIQLTNLNICRETAIEGSLGVKYYCKTLREAIDSTLNAVKELNIPFHESFGMMYIDEDNTECPDKCPEEFLKEYEAEEKRLCSEGILTDALLHVL